MWRRSLTKLTRPHPCSFIKSFVCLFVRRSSPRTKFCHSPVCHGKMVPCASHWKSSVPGGGNSFPTWRLVTRCLQLRSRCLQLISSRNVRTYSEDVVCSGFRAVIPSPRPLAWTSPCIWSSDRAPGLDGIFPLRFAGDSPLHWRFYGANIPCLCQGRGVVDRFDLVPYKRCILCSGSRVGHWHPWQRLRFAGCG